MTIKLLSRLRSLMKDKQILLSGEKLEAYIIPSSDAHGSEYLCENDKRRAFISGFTGSTGTAVVTDQNALLWTDGRYYLQATQQLDSNWTLMKDGLAETPSIGDWIIRNLPPYSQIGIDSSLYEENLFQTLATKLKENSCELVDTRKNLIDLVRDENEVTKFELKNLIKLNTEHTGLSIREKLNDIRDYMKSLNLDGMVVSSLDDIAWLLNLRGRDIPYGTVFFAYCIITSNYCKLFTDLNRLEAVSNESNSTLKSYLLNEDDFEFYRYDQFLTQFKLYIEKEFVEKYKNDKYNYGKIFLSSSSSHAIHAQVPIDFVHKDISYLTRLRTIKNSSEIEGAKRIHIRDSILLVEFFYKVLNYDFKEKNYFNFELNEFNLGKYLDEMRVKNGCFSPSFETICSSGSNGAIIHYKAEELNSNMIEQDNVLLLDSGGHYSDLGTTDVTRTVFLGDTTKITSYQKECFTRVLKGHIQLAMRIFPNKTRPETLDPFARQALWEGGLDYRHGTGHGVGALLNVHEFPIMANRKSIDICVEKNMIITIEPGFYQDGQFGIRIENCYLVVKADTRHQYASNVEFVRFEPLTYVPIQREFIDENLINKEEREWINAYHAKCADIVGNELLKNNKTEIYKWLMEKTKLL